MSGTNDEAANLDADVIVVGGGIAGLTAAALLVEAGSARPGAGGAFRTGRAGALRP